MFTFPPAPVIDDPLIRVGHSGLAPEALARITGYGDALIAMEGEVGRVGFETSEIDLRARVCRVGWLRQGPQTAWMYGALMEVVQDANEAFWRFDLSGFWDALQYTSYDTEGSHFGWHIDMGDKYGGPQRKLSLSLLLSDPADYDGGDFEFMAAGVPRTVTHKEPGTVIVFPAWTAHRVTPVTRGVRKSLVAWACGPRFR